MNSERFKKKRIQIYTLMKQKLTMYVDKMNHAVCVSQTLQCRPGWGAEGSAGSWGWESLRPNAHQSQRWRWDTEGDPHLLVHRNILPSRLLPPHRVSCSELASWTGRGRWTPG